MNVVIDYKNVPKNVRDAMSDGNVFFSEEYYNYSKRVGCDVWYAYDNDYVLPICIYSKIGIKYGSYPTEPICLTNEDSKRDRVVFLNALSDILRQKKITWILTSAASLFDVYPDDSLRIPFGSHVIDLIHSEDELLSNMHSKHRNSIKRAERNGVVVVSGGRELVEDYILIDEETWGRSNRSSYGRDFFSNILDCMKDESIIYVAYKDGIPQSGACFFYNKSMCYYMYGASINNPEPGSANLLQWRAITDMKSKGVEKFSFVGCRINEDEDSKYHGIQRFKERFGGELVRGYMFKTILCDWRYELFNLLYKLKHRDSAGDAVDQEINKWTDLQIIKIGE